MAATYEAIASNTLGSAASSITFSSISASYTDLMLIMAAATGVNDIDLYARVNSDTGTNYSHTVLRTNGSTVTAGAGTNLTYIRAGNMSGSNVGQNNNIMYFFNYSNTTSYKSMITRGNNANLLVEAYSNLWRSNSAINSITVLTQSGNFSAGSVFSLYGIKAA